MLFRSLRRLIAQMCDDVRGERMIENVNRHRGKGERGTCQRAPASALRQGCVFDFVGPALVAGPQTARALAHIVGTGEPNVRKALRSLGKQSLVVTHGGKGRPTTYERATTPD